jgi:hypothetical protein
VPLYLLREGAAAVNAHAQFHIDGHRVGSGWHWSGLGTRGQRWHIWRASNLSSPRRAASGSRPANSCSVASADSRAIAASEGVTLGASARQTFTRSKARCRGFTTAWAASRDLLTF